jgi:acetyl-CoA acetyltransferase
VVIAWGGAQANPERVNQTVGVIALGFHPTGCTGARLITTRCTSWSGPVGATG